MGLLSLVKCTPSVALICVALVALGCAEDVEDNSNSNSKAAPAVVCGRIRYHKTPSMVAGTRTDTNIFPWHVNLYTRKDSSKRSAKEHLCGGTIVHERFVMTSAHCVWDEDSKTTMDAGKLVISIGNAAIDWDSPLNDPRTIKKRDVTRVVVNPNYTGSPSNYAANIAMLEIDSPLKLSNNFPPVCWEGQPSDKNFPRPNTIGDAPGPGLTATGEPSNIIETTRLRVISYEECASSVIDEHVPLITKDKFCTSYPDRTALSYNSRGAAIVFLGKNHQWYAEGIVSGGLETKAETGGRTWNHESKLVHIRIPDHQDFIRDVINNPEKFKHPSYFSTSQTHN